MKLGISMPSSSRFKGINKAEIAINDKTIKVAIANGLKNAEKLLDEVRAGKSEYHFIEVMACPHGCVGGGGQPLPISEEKKRLRSQGLENTDQKSLVRKFHENPMIKKLYDEYLGKSNNKKAHQLLHTRYHKRAKN